MEPTLEPDAIAVDHAHSFHGFMLGLKWVCIGLGTLLTFLLLTFATPAGFGWGLLGGVVVLALGIYAMNHGLSHSTESDHHAIDGA
ncbi:MAG TPA: hypothetical protein VGI95_11570 [Caulobacteraceae bacterium]|jgi:hypothetical protein